LKEGEVYVNPVVSHSLDEGQTWHDVGECEGCRHLVGRRRRLRTSQHRDPWFWFDTMATATVTGLLWATYGFLCGLAAWLLGMGLTWRTKYGR
jgi:hypothetical protein